MKEQHVYKIVDDNDSSRGQVYVFNITRHKNKITIDSIWMVVIHSGLESKVVLNMPGIIEQILLNPQDTSGIKTKETLNTWFSDMKLANEDLIGVDVDDSIDTMELLEAADKAAILHDSKYDDIISELTSGKSKH